MTARRNKQSPARFLRSWKAGWAGHSPGFRMLIKSTDCQCDAQASRTWQIHRRKQKVAFDGCSMQGDFSVCRLYRALRPDVRSFSSIDNKCTVKGTAAGRVFDRLVAQAVGMRKYWPDGNLQGLCIRKTIRQPTSQFSYFPEVSRLWIYGMLSKKQ